MDDPAIYGILAILILILLEGLIVSFRAALNAANEGKIREKADQNDKKSIHLLKIIEQEEEYLKTVQVVINGSGILIGFIYALSLYQNWKNIFSHLWTGNMNLLVPILLAVIFLVLVFLATFIGTTVPERITVCNADKIVYALVNFVWIMHGFLFPITILMKGLERALLWIFHVRPEDLEENVTEDEIMSMINEGHEQGILEASEAEMISNIFDFNDKEVKDIMTHRKNMIAINSEMSLEEALKFMLDESYSRYPLYEEDIDNIIGILHLKDLTRAFMIGKSKERTLAQLARKPYFVPDTQNIDILFRNMQQKKIHMAVAVDEYGQIAGLVAMEDILEEIVGNIMDEYDVDEKFIISQGKNGWLVKGLIDLEDLSEQIGIDLEQEEFDTLNGFLISIIGHIPADGERMTLAYMGCQFEILEVKDNIIRFVRITKDKEAMGKLKEKNAQEAS